ncbi:MAG: penicillin-binding protein 2 [Geminicoccaceae bacterium]|nr:penicillin-binding protein 2 [Geminicoccaceae bacterium]
MTGYDVRPARKDPIRLRIGLVGLFFVIAFSSLAIRLVDLASRDDESGGRPTAMGNDAPDPHRAEILDRNGLLLASNIVTLSIMSDPLRMIDKRGAAHALAGVLNDVDEAELLRRFERGGRFAWIKRHISPREQKMVQDLGLPGVSFINSEMRVYPRGRLASHVLGFVDVDNQGLAGVEFGLQQELVGGAEAGKPDIRLSVDVRAQLAVHEALSKAMTDYSALGGCALVLDVKTRELIAMTSLPDFDPNHPERAPADARLNRCSGSVFELGSMFKIVNTAMALETGKVTMRSHFDASEPLVVNGHRIRDDHGKYRVLSVPEIFAFSSNIGSAQMAFAAGGHEAQIPFLTSLGLMERPQMVFPETREPLVPAKWPDITTATVSYGHGIAVAPLQFAEAVAALVGDGVFHRSKIRHFDSPMPSDVIHDVSNVDDGVRVVSEQTARDLRWLMWLTVERGSGTQAIVPGYLVGGKTGTADKPSATRRGYKKGAVVASFVAAFPVEDPRYVVLVTLDEPQGNKETLGFRYGGWTAAPVVREIIERVGPLMKVEPTRPEVAMQLERRLQVGPAINGRTHREEDGFEAISLAP